MKIILSRKGFDSGFGGYPSAILPSGRMVSFPIPDPNSTLKYHDLLLKENINYANLMHELFGSQIRLEKKGRMQLDNAGCHFDPDIDKTALSRAHNWKGIFGQSGASQSHLKNQNVAVGDIFLFFGWFRKVVCKNDRFSYCQSDKQGNHVIFGYLEVGEILHLETQKPQPWMNYHPHIARISGTNINDTLYIANNSYSASQRLAGYGIFKYNDDLVLTKPGLSKSRWYLPPIFQATSMSYHTQKSWKDSYFQSAAKGQEFVVNCTSEIQTWVKNLIEKSMRN